MTHCKEVKNTFALYEAALLFDLVSLTGGLNSIYTEVSWLWRLVP